MKASELIEIIQKSIDEHGDRDIWVMDRRDGFGAPTLWQNKDWAFVPIGDLVVEAEE